MNDFHRDSASGTDEEEAQWSPVAQSETVEIDYNADTERYYASYDTSVESVCMVVISAVASITDSDPRDLDPIYPVVNPDALDSLFAPKRDGMPRRGGEVTFTYSGYEITVTSNGELKAIPLEE